MLPRGESFADLFQNQANGIATYFGGRVWLVGSMLGPDDVTPGDIDIRVAIDRVDAKRLFFDLPANRRPWTDADWRRARLELKWSRRLGRGWGGACQSLFGVGLFDFQVQIEVGDVYEGKPRIRLDQAPDSFFAAGLGDA